MSLNVLIFIIIALIAVIYVLKGFKIVPQSETRVVERLGRYDRTLQSGINYLFPIIDPETKMPSAYWRSVSVICQDSGMADALSTALFLLPLEEGKTLAARCGVEVLWVDGSKQEYSTSGLEALIRT